MNSKALDPCRIHSHSPLTICLTAVGGNRSAAEETHAEEPVSLLVEHTYIYRYDILVELFSGSGTLDDICSPLQYNINSRITNPRFTIQSSLQHKNI